MVYNFDAFNFFMVIHCVEFWVYHVLKDYLNNYHCCIIHHVLFEWNLHKHTFCLQMQYCHLNTYSLFLSFSAVPLPPSHIPLTTHCSLLEEFDKWSIPYEKFYFRKLENHPVFHMEIKTWECTISYYWSMEFVAKDNKQGGLGSQCYKAHHTCITTYWRVRCRWTMTCSATQP